LKETFTLFEVMLEVDAFVIFGLVHDGPPPEEVVVVVVVVVVPPPPPPGAEVVVVVVTGAGSQTDFQVPPIFT
jgi:hypothetical protein